MTDKEKHEKLLNRLKSLCLLDDKFMTACLSDDIECITLIVRIILNNFAIRILEAHTQHVLKNLHGRSLQFDVYAADEYGHRLNIEIQRAISGAGFKRARYHSSLIDANILPEGDNTENLPETYVIFITEKDFIGDGLAVYHLERQIVESGKPVNDGSHILYVNASFQDDSPIGRLMHDFSCKNAADMYYRELAERVYYYKENPEGVKKMYDSMEDLYQEGKQEVNMKVVSNMLSHHHTPEYIASILELPVEEVEKLKDEMTLQNV